MSDNSRATTIELCPFPTVTPTAVEFPSTQLSICLVADTRIAEITVHDSLKVASAVAEGEKATFCVIYTGSSAPWDRTRALQKSRSLFFWSRELPTFCHIPPTAKSATVAVMRGTRVLLETAQVHTDFKALVQRAQTGVYDLALLARRIDEGDTADLIRAYYEARQSHHDLCSGGVKHILSLVGIQYCVNLIPALPWFQSAIFGDDRSDIISPHDISFRDFLKRLRRYCVAAGQPVKTEEKHSALEAQVTALQEAMQEKDAVIEGLRKELEARESVIQELRDTLSRVFPRHSQESLPLKDHSAEDSFTQEDALHACSKTTSSQEMSTLLSVPGKNKRTLSSTQLIKKTRSGSPAQKAKRLAEAPLLVNSRPRLEQIYQTRPKAKQKKEVSKGRSSVLGKIEHKR